MAPPGAAMIHAPGAAVIEQLARRAIAAMPPLFRAHLDGVSVHIEEFADAAVLAELGIEDPWELTGLYEGRPLTEQSLWDTGIMSPAIRLYRRPLLEEWAASGEMLGDLVTHVLVHEVGHHFGFSDEDMHAIEEERGAT